ncbi:MAG: hypothetical protein V6Z86_08695 [Hyphomicrobiales bacterium]
MSAEMVGLALSASHAMLALSCFSSGYLVSYWSSIRSAATGTIILAMGLFLMVSGRFANIHLAIIGIMLVNAAYGFIVVLFFGDAMSAFGEHRVRTSGFLGFMQPVTGGCAVLTAATLGTSDVDGAILYERCIALSSCRYHDAHAVEDISYRQSLNVIDVSAPACRVKR